MDDGSSPPWFYLAVVAILFVRWLLNQFKNAARVREENHQQRQRQRQRQEQRNQHPTYQPPHTPQQQAEPEVPTTLQELFEQRRRQIAEAQQRGTYEKPPPLPEQTYQPEPAVEEPLYQYQEIEEPEDLPYVPHDSPILTGAVGSRRRSGDSPLLKILSNKDQFRDAIILKEILDKPKGL